MVQVGKEGLFLQNAEIIDDPIALRSFKPGGHSQFFIASKQASAELDAKTPGRWRGP
jgi:hypothetical protein